MQAILNRENDIFWVDGKIPASQLDIMQKNVDGTYVLKDIAVPSDQRIGDIIQSYNSEPSEKYLPPNYIFSGDNGEIEKYEQLLQVMNITGPDDGYYQKRYRELIEISCTLGNCSRSAKEPGFIGVNNYAWENPIKRKLYYVIGDYMVWAQANNRYLSEGSWSIFIQQKDFLPTQERYEIIFQDQELSNYSGVFSGLTNGKIENNILSFECGFAGYYSSDSKNNTVRVYSFEFNLEDKNVKTCELTKKISYKEATYTTPTPLAFDPNYKYILMAGGTSSSYNSYYRVYALTDKGTENNVKIYSINSDDYILSKSYEVNDILSNFIVSLGNEFIIHNNNTYILLDGNVFQVNSSENDKKITKETALFYNLVKENDKLIAYGRNSTAQKPGYYQIDAQGSGSWKLINLFSDGSSGSYKLDQDVQDYNMCYNFMSQLRLIGKFEYKYNNSNSRNLYLYLLEEDGSKLQSSSSDLYFSFDRTKDVLNNTTMTIAPFTAKELRTLNFDIITTETGVQGKPAYRLPDFSHGGVGGNSYIVAIASNNKGGNS